MSILNNDNTPFITTEEEISFQKAKAIIYPTKRYRISYKPDYDKEIYNWIKQYAQTEYDICKKFNKTRYDELTDGELMILKFEGTDIKQEALDFAKNLIELVNLYSEYQCTFQNIIDIMVEYK